jgi:hypothetical protein
MCRMQSRQNPVHPVYPCFNSLFPVVPGWLPDFAGHRPGGWKVVMAFRNGRRSGPNALPNFVNDHPNVWKAVPDFRNDHPNAAMVIAKIATSIARQQ